VNIRFEIRLFARGSNAMNPVYGLRWEDGTRMNAKMALGRKEWNY
jgi:hypothetical protein